MSEAPDSPQHNDAGIADVKPCVLLVDDQRMIAEAVRRMLGDAVDFHFVLDPAQAVAAALAIQPSVILQDLVMPGQDGFSLIKAYRQLPSLREVPVIVLSSNEDAALKAEGFAVGANDYMVKLPDQLELQARVRYHASGYTSRLQRDAAFRALHASQQQLAAANLELERLSAQDALTGLANRRRFDQVMATEWNRGQRNQRPLSLLLCDLDCFKGYNDTYGHPAGDACLQQAAAVMGDSLRRPADVAARYGGEEFALILPDTTAEGALLVAEACRRQLAALALANAASQAGIVTMSVGVATMLPAPGHTLATLIERADQALYQAKKHGRNRVCDYQPTAQG